MATRSGLKRSVFPTAENGFVLILNGLNFLSEKKRNGSQADVKRIKQFFTSLGNYKVKCVEDFTTDDLTNTENGILPTFKRELIEQKADFCFIAIMSHGGENSNIYTYDGQISFQDKILPEFSEQSAPALSHIPKIFGVLACRGNQQWDFNHLMDEVDDSPSEEQIFPKYKNVLVFYSTTDGYVSKRNPEKGTSFVKNLCFNLETYCQQSHFLDIITKVTGQFGSDALPQIPEVRLLGWGKFLFLTPEANQHWIDWINKGSGRRTTRRIPLRASGNDTVDSAFSSRTDSLRFSQLKDGQKIRYKEDENIICRLLCKVQVQTNPSKPTCYKFLFVDCKGWEMEAVAFAEEGWVIYDKIKVGECLKIKEAVVENKKEVFRDWWMTGGTVQLKFRNTKSVASCDDTQNIIKYPKMRIKTLLELEDMNHKDKTDVLGIVMLTPAAEMQKSKKGKSFRKVIIKDNFGTSVVCTFWGQRAAPEKNDILYIRALQKFRPMEKIKMEDETEEELDIATDYHSVPQSAVVIKISDRNQIPPEFIQMYEHFCTSESEKGTKRKMEADPDPDLYQ